MKKIYTQHFFHGFSCKNFNLKKLSNKNTRCLFLIMFMFTKNLFKKSEMNVLNNHDDNILKKEKTIFLFSASLLTKAMVW